MNIVVSEKTFVHDVYDKISEHFDSTRFNPWKGVLSFIETLEKNCKLLDVGCGNGKYFSVRKDIQMYGCDPCESFVNMVKQRYSHVNVVCANGLSLPYNNDYFDAIISIAVLHHLTTFEKRIVFLNEIARVLKKHGKACITVWSDTLEDKRKSKWKFLNTNDVIIPWTDKTNKIHERYYHLFNENEFMNLIENISNLRVISMNIEHGNIHCLIEKV